MRPRRVAVAVHDPQILAELSSWLSRAGHKIVVLAESAEDLSSGCNGVGLDLIITDVQSPGFEGFAAGEDASLRDDVPVIALADYLDEQVVETGAASRIFAQLIKPVRECELLGAVPIVCNRFREFRALREETICMQKALEERKLIERAKGIVMRRQSLDEASAFHHLQQMARNHRLKMAEVAKSIILANETLNGPESTKPQVAPSTFRDEPLRRKA